MKLWLPITVLIIYPNFYKEAMLSQDLKLDGLTWNLFKLKNILFNLQLKEIQSQNINDIPIIRYKI